MRGQNKNKVHSGQDISHFTQNSYDSLKTGNATFQLLGINHSKFLTNKKLVEHPTRKTFCPDDVEHKLQEFLNGL